MKPVYDKLLLQPGTRNFGIVKVQVAPREWLTTDPIIDFNTGKVITAVALAAGRQWIVLEFAQPTYDFDEKPKSNKSGVYFEISLSGTLNHFDAAVQQVVESLRQHQHVAIVTDREKRNKLVGNKDAGLMLSPTNRIQNTSSGQQTSTIELMMESESLAPFYEV